MRLKKKKPRGDDKPKVDPAKPDEKKKDDKAEKKDDKKAGAREAEPVTPQEEEKEVLQRVVKNVHSVGDGWRRTISAKPRQQTTARHPQGHRIAHSAATRRQCGRRESAAAEAADRTIRTSRAAEGQQDQKTARAAKREKNRGKDRAASENRGNGKAAANRSE